MQRIIENPGSADGGEDRRQGGHPVISDCPLDAGNENWVDSFTGYHSLNIGIKYQPFNDFCQFS
jgi:hypothetical protein